MFKSFLGRGASKSRSDSKKKTINLIIFKFDLRSQKLEEGPRPNYQSHLQKPRL